MLYIIAHGVIAVLAVYFFVQNFFTLKCATDWEGFLKEDIDEEILTKVNGIVNVPIDKWDSDIGFLKLSHSSDVIHIEGRAYFKKPLCMDNTFAMEMIRISTDAGANLTYEYRAAFFIGKTDMMSCVPVLSRKCQNRYRIECGLFPPSGGYWATLEPSTSDPPAVEATTETARKAFRNRLANAFHCSYAYDNGSMHLDIAGERWGKRPDARLIDFLYFYEVEISPDSAFVMLFRTVKWTGDLTVDVSGKTARARDVDFELSQVLVTVKRSPDHNYYAYDVTVKVDQLEHNAGAKLDAVHVDALNLKLPRCIEKTMTRGLQHYLDNIN